MPPEEIRVDGCGDRPFLTGTISRGIQKGKPFIIPKKIGGRYLVKDFFAAGGCGILFKGRDEFTENDVLIKMILYDGPGSKLLSFLGFGDTPGAVKHIVQERRKLELERRIAVWLKNAGVNAIPNPNDFVFDVNEYFCRAHKRADGHGVTQISEPGIRNEEPYLVMEWIDGEPLSAEIEKGRPLDEEDVLRIGVELCHIFDVVHRAHRLSAKDGKFQTISVVYQDLKPDNIMRGEGDYLCLLDLGGCRVSVDGMEQSTGANTPGYAPPECYEARPVRHAADIYSLGATLVSLLIGRPMTDFAGNPPRHVPIEISPAERRIAIRKAGGEMEQFSPQCGERLLSVLQRALAKDSASRHDSAARLLEDLNTCRASPLRRRAK